VDDKSGDGGRIKRDLVGGRSPPSRREDTGLSFEVKQEGLLLLPPPLFVSSIMNTASKLGPHTQTDRGTCPDVGL
jgi:hypothetical protein